MIKKERRQDIAPSQPSRATKISPQPSSCNLRDVHSIRPVPTAARPCRSFPASPATAPAPVQPNDPHFPPFRQRSPSPLLLSTLAQARARGEVSLVSIAEWHRDPPPRHFFAPFVKRNRNSTAHSATSTQPQTEWASLLNRSRPETARTSPRLVTRCVASFDLNPLSSPSH